jgi:CSLREA domain-containing protein
LRVNRCFHKSQVYQQKPISEPQPSKSCYSLEAPTIISGTCQTALAWSCTSDLDTDKLAFHRWWLQNVPGSNNGIKKCDPNGTGNPPLLGNWWDYLRGDFPPPGKTYCSPPPVNVSLSGQVSAGPLSGATITLYTLEQGGALLPVSLSGTTTTAADGTYTTPALPASVNGKTLVIQAAGGSFLDEATGQTVSFAGRSLYSVIPQIDLDRPLGGVVTPFTDIAFRLAKRALIVDPTKRPEKEARYHNFWVADIFGLQVNSDESAPSSDYPISITHVKPVNFYTGQKPLWAAPESVYALALAGLSQQAANASLSPAVWIGQLSADADDGVLNGPVVTSVQTLQTAINTYTAGPRSPLGATFTVTKTTDTNDGTCSTQDCSLREAIIAANLTGGPDTIVLPAGTYTLTRSGSDNNSNNGDLDLTNEITLTGAGANTTTIAGGTGWTDRIFDVITTTVQINSLTIQGGNKASSDGGAIYSNNSTLTLSNVAIKNNTANNGGGVYLNLGSVTLLNSAVTGNIANNAGGGIRNVGGTLILTNTTLSGNTAKTDGGGLRSANNGSFVGTTSLTNVTITNNTADSDSNESGEGGGLYRSSGTVTLKNTLIAGNVDNSSATKRPDCSGSITSQGNNLIGNNTGCSFTPASGDQVGTGGSPINPQLVALQDNGGQTLTHALLSNSPAKDTGSNTDCPTTDQRGLFRPQGTTCDIGAYEVAALLDNFNRANGAIGSNWSGNVGGYVIANNRLDVFSNGDIYWKNTSFGANQEAYVTLTTIDTAGQEIDLMLKSQSNTAWSSGGAARLEVWYDPDPNPANSRVRVVTYASGQGWVQRGADIPVSFANGDVFSARATADGRVLVYRNGALLATRDVTGWAYYANGGYIGLWTIGASNALLDDFGGGGVNEP